jgi:hypothetical protein
MKIAELKFHGKPAKIEHGNNGFYILYVQNKNGTWDKENISKSKKHLIGICKFTE